MTGQIVTVAHGMELHSRCNRFVCVSSQAKVIEHILSYTGALLVDKKVNRTEQVTFYCIEHFAEARF